MSKIWDMLKKEKVEWKTLGEVCFRQKGINITAAKMKELNKNDGEVKVFAGGDTVANISKNYLEPENIHNKPSIIVKSRGNIDFAYYDKLFTHKNELWSYSAKNNTVNIKFIFYILKSNLKYFRDNAIKGKLPQISINITDNYKIPIPSLEAQEKIVDILDRFTDCTTNLCSELKTELELRIKQYEYYRAMLLSEEYMKQLTERFLDKNSDLVCKVRLSTVATYSNKKISAEKVNSKTYIGVENLLKDKGGKVDCNHLPNSGTLNAFTQNDILIGNIRPYLRKIWLADIDGGTNGDVLTICIKNEFKNKLLPKFLYQTLSSEEFFYYNIKFSKGAKMPRGDKNKIMEYEFLLPPLQVQEHIVAILDKFHTIVHDLKIGLPKEIELRQKQYEYYRDKLLSFDSCEC